ncbi:SDR family NAD(P)-dependent oxidoreductase [Caulobacter sp. CCNWLY153]|uniref:SDR family NAD(P)-dependent oxidoreductase n=1 Tax=unclassified Caulobacter TaxID=2648921 RepID=UPI002FF2CF3A
MQQRHAQIDGLSANAAGEDMLPLGAITEAHYEDILGRNVKGVIFTVQQVLPPLCGGASVILSVSTTATNGPAAFSGDSASKAAVRNLARRWTLGLENCGISVNVVSPARSRSPAWWSWLTWTGPAVGPARLHGQPDPDRSRRRARGDSQSVLFLASDDSVLMAGSGFAIDSVMTRV